MKIDDVTGVVLAGGKSQRMGFDKASLVLGEKMMIEHSVNTLKSIFNDVMVVTKGPPSFEDLGVKVCVDILPASGALVGIYSALVLSGKDYCFVVACDMPYIKPQLIKWMAESSKGFHAFVPKVGRFIEPLCAVYSKHCVKHIKRRLDQGDFRVRVFFEDVQVQYASESDIRAIDPDLVSFININTRNELQTLLARVSGENGGG